MLALLRSDNLALFRAIKAQPGSIDALAACLQRTTHDVRHDILELERLGIVTVTSTEVRLTAEKFRLEADIV